MSAREVALEILMRVNEAGGYSNLVLKNELNRAGLSARDRSFVSMLVYGVLERQITLDYVLSSVADRRVSEMEPVVRNILRLGAYQLLYMDKVPPSAAINESVESVKISHGSQKSAGFVNAVLHAVHRLDRNITYPPEKNWKTNLGVRYSCPQWLVKLWAGAYGRERCEQLLQSCFGRPPLTVRVNTLRTSPEDLAERFAREGVCARPNPLVEDALDLTSSGAIERLPAYQEGLFHVQDAASQILCKLLDPQPEEQIADVCAAPGGKAFTIAERLLRKGTVSAFDLYPARVDLIRAGAMRLGIEHLHAQVRDACGENDVGIFDRVLCDVPCSGLGILRRKPEIRLRSRESLDNLPTLQYCILVQSSFLVKPGGVLFYSTCTLNPDENGRIADRFLLEHRDFSPLPLEAPDKIERVLQEPRHQLTLLPCVHGTDGFFMAAFRRKG